MICNNIAKYRKINNITQEELSAELNIGRTYLTKLENQWFEPSAKLMEKLCLKFNVTLNDLFYFKED
jgi:DNA-binding XRE family transcriptional regulator